MAAWLAGTWAGLMAGVGFVAAPALFDALPRSDAGRVAARLFAVEATVGIAAGALLLALTTQSARRRAEAGHGSYFSLDMVLALAALFCVIAGHYGLQPMIESARQDGAGGRAFGLLHAASTAFFGARLVIAGWLAWRLGSALAEATRAAAPTS